MAGATNRRNILKGAALAGAMASAKTASGGPIVPPADVIVIGAGLSGLAAAKMLRDGGADVRVLEARDRVGGRVWTVQREGGPLDLGGQFVGTTHTALKQLGDELGLARTPSVRPGDDIWDVAGRLIRAPGGVPALEPEELAELQSAFQTINALGQRVGAARPWLAKDAGAMDGQTVADWLTANIRSQAVRDFHDVAISVLLGAAPQEISLLYWAYYVAQCEGVDSLTATRGGAQESWFVGGAQGVANRIAERLGDRLQLSTAVRAVEQSDNGLSCHTAEGSARARYAILAIPPAAAERIAFIPELPLARAQLQMRAPMGRIAKVIARYPTAFWQKEGLSGVALDTSGPGIITFDDTQPSDTLGTLLGFIAGDYYDRWIARSPPARRDQVLTSFQKWFGPAASAPVFYEEQNWVAETWSRGGPVTFMGTGVMSRFGGALRESIGRLHIAGTEAAPMWTGYMEGAVRAGQAAAKAVLKQLSNERS